MVPPPKNGTLLLLPRPPPPPPPPPPKNGTTPVQQLQQQQYTTLQPQSPFAALGSSSDAAVIRVSHAQRQHHQQQQHQLHAAALQQQYRFIVEHQQQQQQQQLHAAAADFAALQQQYQFIVQHQQQQHLQPQLHAAAADFAALQRQYRFAIHHQQQKQQQQYQLTQSQFQFQLQQLILQKQQSQGVDDVEEVSHTTITTASSTSKMTLARRGTQLESHVSPPETVTTTTNTVDDAIARIDTGTKHRSPRKKRSRQPSSSEAASMVTMTPPTVESSVTKKKLTTTEKKKKKRKRRASASASAFQPRSLLNVPPRSIGPITDPNENTKKKTTTIKKNAVTKKKTISKTLNIDSTEYVATGTVPITTTDTPPTMATGTMMSSISATSQSNISSCVGTLSAASKTLELYRVASVGKASTSTSTAFDPPNMPRTTRSARSNVDRSIATSVSMEDHDLPELQRRTSSATAVMAEEFTNAAADILSTAPASPQPPHRRHPRGPLPTAAVTILKAWFFAPENVTHPYPTPSEQVQLRQQTGLEITQLRNWFVNARQRIWKPVVGEGQRGDTNPVPEPKPISRGRSCSTDRERSRQSFVAARERKRKAQDLLSEEEEESKGCTTNDITSTSTSTAAANAVAMVVPKSSHNTTTNAATASTLLRSIMSTSMNKSMNKSMRTSTRTSTAAADAVAMVVPKTTEPATAVISYFFDQAAILPSSLPNGLVTIPEKLRQIFDRVGSHKLKMMFPNKSQEEINQLLAEIWKEVCDEKLSEVLNLQHKRYKAHEELRKIEWKIEKPNIKYRPNTADSRMIGLVCDSPTNPKFETITSIWNKGFDPYKNLQADLVTAMYNSALPIGSDVTDFDHTKIVHILHFPGETNTQKCIEKGLLWKAENGAIGEPCLRYPIAKWAKLASLLGITTDDDVCDELLKCSAFSDICPIIAFNKCGGSHNNATIRDYMTTILVEYVKRCRNITHISVFGADPRVYVEETLKPILKSQVKNNLTYTFNKHPASFMMGGATLVDAQNFCKTGLMNLSLALNMDPKTVANYQARIDSDDDLVTTLVNAGRSAVENKTGIFAEGGAGTPLFTPNQDKLLVKYYYMFSLHDEGKWDKIAVYFKKFNGQKCHHRMKTLLQKHIRGRIRYPSSLQIQLQEQEPPVTCRSFRYIRSWNLERKPIKRNVMMGCQQWNDNQIKELLEYVIANCGFGLQGGINWTNWDTDGVEGSNKEAGKSKLQTLKIQYNKRMNEGDDRKTNNDANIKQLYQSLLAEQLSLES